MFALFNIQITYLFLTFIKTVLTNTPTNPSHKKVSFSDIPIWLWSIIILLGITDLLLAIYLILNFIKRRRRKEDEGNRKVVDKEEEKNIEQLQAAHTTPSSPLIGREISSPIEENPSTSVNHTCDMDLDSHVKYDDQSTSIDNIREIDQSLVAKEEDQSISIDTISENEPLLKEECFSSSIGTFSEYNRDSDSKEVNHEAFSSIDSHQEITPDVKEAYDGTSSSLEFNQERTSNGKEEQSGSSQDTLSSKINSEMKNSKDGEEEELTISINKNDLEHKYEQEVVSSTPVENTIKIDAKAEIVEEKVSEIRKEEGASEKRTEDMATSEKLEEGMPALLTTEETPGKIGVARNDEKDEFTKDSSLVEVKEPITSQDAAVSEGVITQEEITSLVSEENSSDTSKPVSSVVSGSYTSEHTEGASSNSKENLNGLEYSHVAVKARNGGIRQKPRSRRFSRISSKVLSAAGKVQDISSSESE